MAKLALKNLIVILILLLYKLTYYNNIYSNYDY